MLSAWPPLALSFSMEIHLLPGCHPFIFSHPSSNWGFHLISTVYSSYEVKSWETFESVDPDDELQLIPHSAEAKDSSSFSTDKNFKKRNQTLKMSSILHLFLYGFITYLCLCSSQPLAQLLSQQVPLKPSLEKQGLNAAAGESCLEERREPWNTLCFSWAVHLHSTLIYPVLSDGYTDHNSFRVSMGRKLQVPWRKMKECSSL